MYLYHILYFTEQAVSHQLQEAESELVPLSFKTIHEGIEKFKKEWESKIQNTNEITDKLPTDQEMTDLSTS